VRAISVFLSATLLSVVTGSCLADDSPEPGTVVRIGPGVTPPKIKYHVEPEYSPEARQAGVQGTVVFEVVVDVTGRLTNISVLSPLGFGLDEKAQEAIEKWRFEPGRKDGKPVNILATIEVNFRLLGRNFDSKAEDQRVRFNVALAGLRGQDEQRRKQAIKALEDLVKHGFPPAMYVLGKLLEAGDLTERDAERGKMLIRKAADKHHGPALFDLGSAYCEGRGVAKDTEQGMRMIEDAARLGSYAAQFYLGNYFEQGIGGSRDLDRARRDFRLCAAAGHADCQVRLAKLLLAIPERREREYVQAVAWLELAADQGQPEATRLVEQEAAHLTSEQASAALRLKAQLSHKP
jgi:TonB family protein